MTDLNSNSIDPRLREIAAASAYQSPILQTTQQSPITPLQYDSSQLYLQQTPGTDHDGNASPDGDANDPKRPRACEACRGLKVKCEPDVNNPDGPCKRCAKASRNCVVTVPSRKRQKKTDSRVAELEKKIDALTATLAQKSAAHAIGPTEQESNNGASQARVNQYQQVTNGAYSFAYAQPPETRGGEEWAGFSKPVEHDGRKASTTPVVLAGQKRKHDGHDYSARSDSPSSANVVGPGFLMESGIIKPSTHAYADVIDRGLLTMEMAATMFQCYVDKMSILLGAVTFPAGTTAAEVRKHQPDLFLSILSAASGSVFPKLQRQLTKEIMARYAERIIVNGEKTLELVQAIHVSTLWYYPPEHFEELKFYSLIHIAAVMAIDIGLGKRTRPKKQKPAAALWRDHAWRRTPYPDAESIEARRTWLACYVMCANTAMGLRRPNLVRWTSFIGECVEFLESSPEARPTDLSLCQWVRILRIAEDIGIQFSMDEPVAALSFNDSKVQYTLKGFERDLQKWNEQLRPELSSPVLRVMEHVVNLYMHEVALHVNHNVEEFKPPFTEESLRGNPEEGDPKSLTPAHVNALSTCLNSIDGIINTFLLFDVDTICCLPAANFVRVAYAIVVLIKMFFAAARPNSEHGQVIDKDNMKVEQYLDGLVEKFKAAAAEERSRPAAKFLMVLLMLRTWFLRQRESKSQPPEQAKTASSDPSAISKDSGARRDGESGFTNQNTPLQLLSEVATGNSGGPPHPGNSNNYPASSNWQEQQVSYPAYGPTTQYSMNQGYNNANASTMATGNIDPNLGSDLGYMMGDNLEQAMGMTMGAGDFGDYFGEDAFFGGLMDGVPVFEGGF